MDPVKLPDNTWEIVRDQYKLFLLPKEFQEEDVQCGNNCMSCHMSGECEKLNYCLERIFNIT